MEQSPGNTIPQITVVLPVYNGEAYLQHSVQSVLNQRFIDFELLIIDDCSTDGSLQYLQGLDDKRITLFVNEKNRGLFYNLNFLIKKSRSGLIKLWSQDDVMLPHCLGSFVDFYNLHPDIGFIYSQRDIIDKNGRVKELGIVDTTPTIISPSLHAAIAYYTGSITGNISSACISLKALQQVGMFNEQMKISADFEMWVRLARNHNTGFINDHLLQLRDHSGQLSRNEILYIFHLREDLEVYRYLDSYTSTHIKEEGKKLMRQHKLAFYYTLMVKALVKGNLNTARLFFRELSRHDNFFMLSLGFLKAKLGRQLAPDFLEKFKA